ncbi:MAG: hypothetical protein AB7H66_02550 [Hyphomonadaceae bacterium]
MDWQHYLHFMQALRANMLRAESSLAERGYRFNEIAVTEPTVERAETIALIESSGLRMPAALKAFYEVFGSIDFEGAPPADWEGCDYPDPLSVVPLDLKFWRGELERWTEENEPRFTPQFAGDQIHKAGFSGGGYYFDFDGADDPLLIAEDLPERFTAYLALCNEWAGFPGLRHCPEHTWPIAKIKRGFVDLP